MKIVVGLGNPGKRYQGTRHNIGFEIVAEMVRRHAPDVRPKAKFDGELIDASVEGHPTCFVWPLTFMNRSGHCVRQIVDFYKIELSELLIVCDDFQLPLAKLRFRPDGTHGGQNGLEDVLAHLATLAVPRLRFGIGPLRPGWDAADFVLARFDSDERSLVEPGIHRAADAVRSWIREGIDMAMNQYNRDPAPATDSQNT